MVEKHQEILIAGGGIGGLTTALYLHQAGIPVKVFESARTITPLGLGLNLLPHAVKRLFSLGLQNALEATGVRTKELNFYTKRGALIWSEPRGLDAGYDVPQYSIHRGALQMRLLQAAQERIGADNVLTGHHLASFEQDADGVTAHFIDKNTGDSVGSYRGAALIGADGVMSEVRAALYPDEGMPVYSGLILWRGAVGAESFLSGRSMFMAGHNTVKAVAYPIAPPDANTGKQLINWVSERPVPLDLPPKKEDWNRVGDVNDFLDYFEDWQFSWLNVPELFKATETIYEFPMIDRDPVPQWSFGRVTLLGDAAHAMRPNGSNGASQAIWDAEILAEKLSALPDVVQALKAYEAVRLQPVSKLVLDNRKTGPERVLQMAEDACDGTCTDVCEHVPYETLDEIARSYKRLAGFDKDSVKKQG
jgi:2-polyprenyl-6-methoxyphenol hydroxylase-like FAD-dependent oxidoreductase